MLLKLLSSHWNDAFFSNIKSSPEDVENWPAMDSQKCSFHTQLNRAEKEGLFEWVNLKQLNKAHEDCRYMAQAIQFKYLAGDVDRSREGLAALQTILDEMHNTAEMCK